MVSEVGDSLSRISEKVNKTRLEKHLNELAQIGTEKEGLRTRLPYTKAEREAVNLVQRYMEEAGLKTYYDQFGNLFGRLDGLDVDAPVVMTGSHVDTVIYGGAFDGAVGTLGAIEAIQVIKENNLSHNHTLEVGVFVSEEPVRFGAGTLGSKAVVGDFTIEDLDRLRDKEGTTLAQALRQWGFDPMQLETVKRNPATLKCFIELHIEQSVVLENKKIPIGVVDKIAAPTNLRLTIKGRARRGNPYGFKARRIVQLNSFLKYN